MTFATFIEAMASSVGLEFASEVSRLMAKAVSVAFAMGIAHGKSYDLTTTVAERARVQQTLQELTGAAVGDLFALAGRLVGTMFRNADPTENVDPALDAALRMLGADPRPDTEDLLKQALLSGTKSQKGS